MNREKKIKLFLGSAYILIVFVFLLIFFNNFSFQDFSSYELIRENRDALDKLKNSNIFLASIFFLLGTIVWVLLLGLIKEPRLWYLEEKKYSLKKYYYFLIYLKHLCFLLLIHNLKNLEMKSC